MNATDDWYDIVELYDGAWRVAEAVVFGSYLIAGEERALLIDAGIGVGDLRGMVEELVDVPVTLLLSHSHWDHVVNGNQFEDVVADPREHDDGRITGGGFDYGPEQWIDDWRETGRGFPDGFDPDEYEIEPITGVESIGPGETVDLGGRELELLAVPGHSPGQLAVLDREAGALFGSDVIHNDYGLYVHFEGCNAREYLATFERLIDLRDAGAFDTLYLSHSRPLSGDDLSLMDSFRDGLEAILADELDYERVDDGTPARRYEIAGKDVLTKPDVT